MSENTPFSSSYARSIGITEADAHTARNIHLSVADCKHLRRMLRELNRVDVHGEDISDVPPAVDLDPGARRWNQELSEYLKGAV